MCPDCAHPRATADLGVSGQWIEGISREIASIAANPGHGRFSVASPGLGAVQVEIAPGKSGSRILMQVDSDAAQAAYEAEHGPLADDVGIVFRSFATPEDRENEK